VTHRLLLPALVMLLPALGGCPLPIAHTETASQPLSGVYRRADGTPITDAWVRLSTDYRDSACMHYTLTTLTDSAGRFHLPATQKHYNIMWFVPNLDRVDPGYAVCLEQGNDVREAYSGRGSIANESVPEAISCVLWEWDSGLHTSCSGSVERSLVTGGQWKTGDGVGWYRVFLVSDDNVRRDQAHILLQWVEERSSGKDSVVSTQELPVNHSVWALHDPEIFQEDGRWYLSLDGLRHVLMSDTKSSHIRFRLGPPGEAPTVQPY